MWPQGLPGALSRFLSNGVSSIILCGLNVLELLLKCISMLSLGSMELEVLMNDIQQSINTFFPQKTCVYLGLKTTA
jgi:hypothetical protein